MIRTYKYRLYPTRKQAIQLHVLQEQGRQLYNRALRQQTQAYQRTGEPLRFLTQLMHFRYARAEIPDTLGMLSDSCIQNILSSVSKTLHTFTNRVEHGLEAHLPRPKPRHRFRSLTFAPADGCTLITDEQQRTLLAVQGVGAIKVKYHRPLHSDAIPKRITVGCSLDQWYVAIQCEIALPRPIQHPQRSVHLTPGNRCLLQLDGVAVDAPETLNANLRKLRHLRQKIDRCQHASIRYRQRCRAAARLQTRIAHQRRDFQHKLARQIVDRYRTVALDEAVATATTTRRTTQVPSALYGFIEVLATKAASTGTGIAILANNPSAAPTWFIPPGNHRVFPARTERSCEASASARSRQTEAESSQNPFSEVALHAGTKPIHTSLKSHCSPQIHRLFQGDKGMALGGYANKVGRVNLTTGTVNYESIPEEWALKYIGGRGLGVRYCLEKGAQVDPLGPDNLLAFMNGPLTGTRANMSGRMAIVTKSPLTGTITDSHHGGWSAARMRWAGFDALLVEGKADKPVYLYIEDGTVSVKDASAVWGMGVHDTVKHFQNEYGEKDLSVIAIGQGGEKMVNFACWINEMDRASGRGGTGAVGGSKMLKAVVIKAKRAYPDAANPKAFKDATKQALATIMDENNITAPRKGGLSVLGTNMLMNATNSIGALPTKNSQTTSFGDSAELISGEYVKENVLVNDPTCHACPVACKKEVEVEYNGKTVRMESVEYEPAWSFGAHSGNDNVHSVAFMIDQCNDYGIDAIEMGNCLSTYMEVCDKGWNGTDSLAWGDHAKMVQLVEKTGMREGVGEILAGGVKLIAEHYGHPEVGMQVRGQSIPAYDPRGLKGMGLGFATSNRGACHLRGYSPASELGVIGLKTDPLAWEGKGELLKLLQDLHAFSDSLDLCKFSAFAEGGEEYAMQYAAMVGLDEFTADDVVKIGERIYNLERYYNQLAGEKPGSDVLPKRFTEEPSTSPGSEGHVCELDKMLEEYYALRGWDNGVPTEAKLRELEIIA